MHAFLELGALSLPLSVGVLPTVSSRVLATVLDVTARLVLLAFPFLVFREFLWLLIVDDPVTGRISTTATGARVAADGPYGRVAGLGRQSMPLLIIGESVSLTGLLPFAFIFIMK